MIDLLWLVKKATPYRRKLYIALGFLIGNAVYWIVSTRSLPQSRRMLRCVLSFPMCVCELAAQLRILLNWKKRTILNFIRKTPLPRRLFYKETKNSRCFYRSTAFYWRLFEADLDISKMGIGLSERDTCDHNLRLVANKIKKTWNFEKRTVFLGTCWSYKTVSILLCLPQKANPFQKL